MQFRCRLAPSVPGPVHAVCDQRNGGRIHGMNRSLETPRQRAELRPVPRKPGALLCRCSRTSQNSCSIMPASRCLFACESVLRLGAAARIIPNLAAWCPDRVTDIVETHRVRELGEQQGDDMTQRSKTATAPLNPEGTRQISSQVGRNEVAQLVKYADAVFGRFRMFHSGGILPSESPHRPPLSLRFTLAYGTAVFLG